jgi:hypothetical protein
MNNVQDYRVLYGNNKKADIVFCVHDCSPVNMGRFFSLKLGKQLHNLTISLRRKLVLRISIFPLSTICSFGIWKCFDIVVFVSCSSYYLRLQGLTVYLFSWCWMSYYCGCFEKDNNNELISSLVYNCIISFERSAFSLTCNQCLSPLTIWVRIPLMARCNRYNIMW